MEPVSLALLAAVALATAVLSAIVGMAGGMVLLGVMLLFFEPLVAIPLHGVVQLVSNGARMLLQREHVAWKIVGRFALPLLPMAFLGLAVLRALPPDWARGLIGLFVLVATWAPGWLLLGAQPERADAGRRFVALGAVAGVLNVTVGATGALIAPFFLGIGLARQAVIGTQAACQALGHAAKLVVFGVAGFEFSAYVGILALLAVAVLIGTWIGSRILGRVSETLFVRLYQGVLTLVALRLMLGAGLAALGPR